MASSPLSLFPHSIPPREQGRPLRVNTDANKQPSHCSEPSLVQSARYGMSGITFEVTEGDEVSPMAIRSQHHNHQRSMMPITAHDTAADAAYGRTVRSVSPQQEPRSPHFSTPNRTASHRLPASSSSTRELESIRLSPLSFHAGESRNTTPIPGHEHSEERVDSPLETKPMRSIFPQLQPGIPLSLQPYGPQRALAVAHTNPRSLSAPLKIQVPVRPSNTVLPPLSSRVESLKVWRLANGERGGRYPSKAQFNLSCEVTRKHGPIPSSPGLDICVSDSSGAKAYQAIWGDEGNTQDESVARTLRVQRYHPQGEGAFPVVHMECPQDASSTHEGLQEIRSVASIFPHVAALNALRHAAGTAQARHIAQYDPDAVSPQAARLAFDAVEQAKEAEVSLLIYRSAPTVGASTSSGLYELHHRTVGALLMTVEGNIDLLNLNRRRRKERGRVVLHFPATAVGSTADLATIDLANERLELNLETLCGDMDSLYMIDTAITALVTVAVMETARIKESKGDRFFQGSQDAVERQLSLHESHMFAGPPRRGVASIADRRANADEDSLRMPTPLRMVLKLLGFALDAVVWILTLGVRVLTRLISCIGEKPKT